MHNRPYIYLIDLPTFPKGVISLSFPAIAASLPNKYEIRFIDLNINNFSETEIHHFKNKYCLFIGLKVSSQNYKQAIQITDQLKRYDSNLIVVWGGEYPSLLPNLAINYADTIVCGAFENIATELLKDIESGMLQKIYNGKNNYTCEQIKVPDYSIIKDIQLYSQVMGFPMETSRGCDKKCTFCMVHTMQPLNNFKTPLQLKNELKALNGKFVNVIDYNIGADTTHFNNVIEAFSKSEVHGWMGEMCLENLDNDELLIKLAKSRCRIVYCGLESISETSLISINKAKTNNIENYTRIIKKVQSYGIQIAAGVIIGMEGANTKTINDTFQFFIKMGLIYTKITFLTYNPGTKVYESMKRVGKYTTEEHHQFDGNHFTFLPFGVNQHEVTSVMIENIKLFYSLKNILKRASNANLKGLAYREFIYFNINYRDVYLQWLKFNIFEDKDGFNRILNRSYKKSMSIIFAEKSIIKIRKKRVLVS